MREPGTVQRRGGSLGPEALFRIIGSYSAPGPHGFERTVTFAIDDDPAVIAERVRETMED
jgi:hypothetical protein